MADKTYVNQKEAAAMLGVSPSTVRNMVKDGRLKPRKIYKRALYQSEAVRRLLQDVDDKAPPVTATTTQQVFSRAIDRPGPPTRPTPDKPATSAGWFMRAIYGGDQR
jgi:excisionase family DNA binding protein